MDTYDYILNRMQSFLKIKLSEKKQEQIKFLILEAVEIAILDTTEKKMDYDTRDLMGFSLLEIITGEERTHIGSSKYNKDIQRYKKAERYISLVLKILVKNRLSNYFSYNDIEDDEKEKEIMAKEDICIKEFFEDGKDTELFLNSGYWRIYP